MPDEPLRVLEDPAAADIEFLVEQINDHNADVTGHHDGRMLAIFLRDDRGAIRAGLSGHTWGGCADVKWLWVREAERRSGIGSRLLAAAEREAQERGCRQIVLSTHSFQAPEFYRKQVYTIAGEFLGYPVGGSLIFLRKALG